MGKTSEFYGNISKYITPVHFAFPGGAILSETDHVLDVLGLTLPRDIQINGRGISPRVFSALGDFLRTQGPLQCIDERIGREKAGQVHEACAASELIAKGLRMGISGAVLSEMIAESGVPKNPLLGDRHVHKANGAIISWLNGPLDSTWGLDDRVVQENLRSIGAPLVLSCPTTPLLEFANIQKSLSLSEKDELVSSFYDISLGIANSVLNSSHNSYPQTKSIHVVELNQPKATGGREAALIRYAGDRLRSGLTRNIRSYLV